MLPFQRSFAQKRHDLLGIERPVQLRASIDAPQDGNAQSVIIDQPFVFADVHQLNQQTMLDQRQQLGFSDFA